LARWGSGLFSWRSLWLRAVGISIIWCCGVGRLNARSLSAKLFSAE